MGQAEASQLNLASLESIQGFARAFAARGLPLHCLILNAGVFLPPYSKTEWGSEVRLRHCLSKTFSKIGEGGQVAGPWSWQRCLHAAHQGAATLHGAYRFCSSEFKFCDSLANLNLKHRRLALQIPSPLPVHT